MIAIVLCSTRLTHYPSERLLTHHCDRRRAGDRRGRVEDHAADPVDAHRGRARLHLGVVGVGRARNRDPVRGALRADHAALRYRPARYAKRHGRRVYCKQAIRFIKMIHPSGCSEQHSYPFKK